MSLVKPPNLKLSVKGQIIKRNRIYSLEQNDNKIKELKTKFKNHVHIINKLDGYNDTIIDDLYRIGYYDPDRYILEGVKIYICNILYKYIDEFHNDKDILNFFVYICYSYNVFN